MEKSPHNQTGGQHFGLKENPLVHFAGLLSSFGLKCTEISDANIVQLLIVEENDFCHPKLLNFNQFSYLYLLLPSLV